MKTVRVLLFALAILTFVSCSKRTDTNYKIRFVDSAGLYSQQFQKTTINNLNFPKGIPVLILTVDSIPLSRIGFFGQALLDNSSNWLSTSKEQENCILLIVSKQPNLLQIRYGENLRLEAYRQGLYLGTKYRQCQDSFISQGNEKGLVTALDFLQKELPDALDLSFLMKIEKPGVQLVYDEISDFAMPSDNAYTHFIFTPYSTFLTSTKLFSHPLILVAINALLLFLIVKIGSKFITALCGKTKTGLIVSIIWKIIAGLLFSVPFWGSIIFLSSLRIEDHLFASYLGIPIFHAVTFTDWMSAYTPLWIALIIMVIVFAVDFPKFYLARIALSYLTASNKEDARREAERDMDNDAGDLFFDALSRGIGFGFFALFMPRAIALLLLFYYLVKVPETIKNYKTLNKLNI